MIPTALDLSLAWDFAVALLIGGLVGIEREKRKALEDGPMIGGIRTFVLFALIGAVGAHLSRELGTPWIFVAALACVTAALVAGYIVESRARPASVGLTTEMAAIAVVLLAGATVFGQREIAVALAVVVSAALAFKVQIHGLVARIGADDLFAGLRLLIATFIVLPLLPDRAIDPLGAVNPHAVWLLAILIAGLSLVGYVAVRWLGTHPGFALTGVAGGLVSSTAVTLAFARRGREAGRGALGDALAAGIVLAWSTMFARVLVEVAVVNPDLLASLGLPFAALAGVGVLFAAELSRRGRAAVDDVAGNEAGDEDVVLRNPFSLTAGARFAAFFVVVLVVVKLVERSFPDRGLYVVALLAGTTDVDAITLSMAAFAGRGGDACTAAMAITLAALANTVIKCGLVMALGGAATRGRIVAATVLMLLVGAAGLWLAWPAAC